MFSDGSLRSAGSVSTASEFKKVSNFDRNSDNRSGNTAILETSQEIGLLQTPIPGCIAPFATFDHEMRRNMENAMSTTNLLHILTTDQLGEGEILVRFSDGTTAVFDCAELEKLRPRRKEMPIERKIA